MSTHDSTMNTHFYCYSIALKNFLKLQGLRYEYSGLHPNGNIYWVFRRDATLSHALNEWTRYKILF